MNTIGRKGGKNQAERWVVPFVNQVAAADILLT